MAETVFEKIVATVEQPGGGQVRLGKGRLFVRDGGLEFQNEKGTLSMRPVRSIEQPKGSVKVQFGEGQDLRAVYLLDLSRGAFRGPSQARVLGEELRRRLEIKGLSGAESAGQERVETAEAMAGIRKAKVQMWVWGLVALAGTIATIATISAASEGGGSYYVFWGAIVFGIGGFLAAYFDHYRKHRKVLDRAHAGEPKTGEPPG